MAGASVVSSSITRDGARRALAVDVLRWRHWILSRECTQYVHQRKVKILFCFDSAVLVFPEEKLENRNKNNLCSTWRGYAGAPAHLLPRCTETTQSNVRWSYGQLKLNSFIGNAEKVLLLIRKINVVNLKAKVNSANFLVRTLFNIARWVSAKPVKNISNNKKK